jgi:tetratricopeptide (TPR) repeat protein
MNKLLVGFLCIAALGWGGCRTQYNVVKSYTKGEYYLQTRNYSQGLEAFEQEVTLTPENAWTQYYLGRFALAENQPQKALKHLKQAVLLSPDNADFHFWLGLAYSANGRPGDEHRSYRKALALDPDHVQALIYLGHNQMEKKQYPEALQTYTRALELAPYNSQSLYNRAYLLRWFKRTPEEIVAWRLYLEAYPSGALARKAVEYLNAYGIFDYRNHLIGKRTVTLQKMRFEPLSAELHKDSEPSLDFLGALMEGYPQYTLQIVVYQKNNVELAKQRAERIKEHLLRNHRRIQSSRIQVSWFKVPEKIKIGKRTYARDASVNFFTTR